MSDDEFREMIEWAHAAGLTDEDVAERLHIARPTVAR